MGRRYAAWVTVLLVLPAATGQPALTATAVSAEPDAGDAVLVLALDSSRGVAPRLVAEQLRWASLIRGRLGLAILGDARGDPAEADGWQQEALPALLERVQPDWIVVLEEDYDFHAEVSAAYGATVAPLSVSLPARSGVTVRVAGVDTRVAGQLRAGAAGATGDGKALWRIVSRSAHPRGEAVKRLLGRADASSFLVTTSAKNERKRQRVALRTRELRSAVYGLLAALEMCTDQPGALLPPRPDRRLRAAIYDGDGAVSSSGHDPLWIKRSLRHHGDMRVALIGPEDINDGLLSQFDVVVFGGGSSSRQGKGLGDAGRRRVRDFVREGGGYVGICAGAFLAANARAHDLFLVRFDRDGTSGSDVVGVDFSPAAGDAIGVTGRFPVKMSGGPLIHLEDLPSTCEVWGTFTEDLPRSDKPDLKLKGTVAVFAAPYHAGRVVVFSPHCERYPGPQQAFWNALRWAGRQDAKRTTGGARRPACEVARIMATNQAS